MFLLPSLQALKIFECTCRLSSFTKAAEELGVSQGAISQHIKGLEVRVGFEVFSREGRQISLTPAGAELLAAVKHGLNHIQHCIELERRKQHSNELVLSVLPGFAIRWLFPRLMAFNEAYPHIKISVNAVASPLDFDLYHAHAALAYGPKEIRSSKLSALFNEQLMPVCSPDFAHQHNLQPPLDQQQLQQLAELPLLGDESPTPPPYGDTWGFWAEQVGIDLPTDKVGRHSQSNITLQLAELGHGIAIGRTSLVMDAVKRKQLTVLTDIYVDNPCSYFLCTNPAIPASSALHTFTDWLITSSKTIQAFQLADVLD
ncbi:LysR substrate-binding domain-containing protein [Aliamphritea ceti]|uniref:LysR substrate-binding domain-containing protein n=1 Tax=Aliamphritea ceti TaxID=1524258 RepID=UPI0021C47F92|nr:LysR substrate-binding domain-containing protein [Aliamphritea ceti]